MQLFENALKLRGFLGKDAEVPSSDHITDDAYAVLTLCLESGVWWRPQNEWISDTAWYRIICPGPDFCGLTRGMTQGTYLEVDAQLHIAGYADLRHSKPIYEVRAAHIRRLDLPFSGVIDQYNG